MDRFTIAQNVTLRRKKQHGHQQQKYCTLYDNVIELFQIWLPLISTKLISSDKHMNPKSTPRLIIWLSFRGVARPCKHMQNGRHLKNLKIRDKCVGEKLGGVTATHLTLICLAVRLG